MKDKGLRNNEGQQKLHDFDSSVHIDTSPEDENREKTPWEKTFAKIYKVIMWICMACMLAQVVVVVWVVFGRFVLNDTPKWGEEVALLAMVWLSLFSASLAIKEDRHIRMSVVDNLFSEKALIIRDMFFAVLNTIFCGYLTVQGWKLAQMTANSIMPGSRLSTALLYIPVPIACIFMMLMLIYELGGKLCQLKR